MIAKTLGAVTAAVHRSEAVEIQYRLLSRPEPKWRWIAPHAIGFDGFRWHAPAYCEIDKTFKDFLLSRVIEIDATRSSDSDPGNDLDWQEYVVLEINPHPALSDTQEKVVSLDYGMRSSNDKIQIRRAFLYYTLKRLSLFEHAACHLYSTMPCQACILGDIHSDLLGNG